MFRIQVIWGHQLPPQCADRKDWSGVGTWYKPAQENERQDWDGKLEQRPSLGREEQSRCQPPGNPERRELLTSQQWRNRAETLREGGAFYRLSVRSNRTWNLELCQFYGPINHFHCLSYLNWISCSRWRYVCFTGMSEKLATFRVHPWRSGCTQSPHPEKLKGRDKLFYPKGQSREANAANVHLKMSDQLIFITGPEMSHSIDWHCLKLRDSFLQWWDLLLVCSEKTSQELTSQHPENSLQYYWRTQCEILILKESTSLMVYHHEKMGLGSKLRGIRGPLVDLHQLDQWANTIRWGFSIANFKAIFIHLPL